MKKITSEMLKDDKIALSVSYRKIRGTRKAGVNYFISQEEMNELVMCSLIPERFAQVIGINLRDRQKATVKNFDLSKFFVLHAARQTGTTTIMTFIALRESMLKGLSVAIVSRKKAYARHVMDTLTELYIRTPFYMKKGLVKMDSQTISFENNGIVKMFTDTKQMRGASYDVVLYSDPGDREIEDIIMILPVVSARKNDKMAVFASGILSSRVQRLVDHASRHPMDPKRNGWLLQKVGWWEVPGFRNNPLWKETMIKSLGSEEKFDAEFDIH